MNQPPTVSNFVSRLTQPFVGWRCEISGETFYQTDEPVAKYNAEQRALSIIRDQDSPPRDENGNEAIDPNRLTLAERQLLYRAAA